MLRHYLTITLRILWRNRATTFVNVFGLSAGMAAFILIMLYAHHELSYDRFNVNYNRIYRLEGDEFGMLPPLFGTRISRALGEVEAWARFHRHQKRVFTYAPNDAQASVRQIEVLSAYCDGSIFSVFTFPFIEGDPNTALGQPNTAVLTEVTAEKLFGDKDAIGKVFIYENTRFTITGILKEAKPSHMEFGALLSLPTFYRQNPTLNYGRTGPLAWSATYLLLKRGASKTNVEKKINETLREANDVELVDTRFRHFRIRPLADLYFEGETQKLSYGFHGNRRNVTTLVIASLFVLVLAGVNYTSLTTARSIVRIKEMAVKRMTGSTVSLLRWQLIGESVIISLLSLAVALTMVQQSLPRINEVIAIDIQMNDLGQPLTWAGILAGGVLIGVLSGLYPSFYLTVTEPVKLMRMASSPGGSFRSVLMTFQFGLSIAMIVAFIVNFRQLNYMRSADLGFDKQILWVNTFSKRKNQEALKDKFRTALLQHSGIENVSFSGYALGSELAYAPTLVINGSQIQPRGLSVDREYLDVMGIKLVAGRGFAPYDTANATINRGFSIHSASATLLPVLINETMARSIDLKYPVGTKAQWSVLSQQGITTKDAIEIIGVVRDFHVTSLHDKVEPILLVQSKDASARANIKISQADIPSKLKIIETEFKKIWPEKPFVYEFQNEAFNRQYQRDERQAMVIGYFTGLALVIACLGLFALSSFVASRRVKEIGVRKVVGASVGSIYAMLSWDFLKWIIVAFAIASPLSWYLMDQWLETFAYHITLTADIFVIAGLVAVGIAMLTVASRSWRAARANPVESLKYE